jgi:dihydroorotate dehydrogenase (NAD+) catalytic subunit
MVHEVAKAVEIPVVGMGGIAMAEDALRFIMAGASAVSVGCMTFAKPTTMPDIIDGLEAYCEQEQLSNVLDVRGII